LDVPSPSTHTSTHQMQRKPSRTGKKCRLTRKKKDFLAARFQIVDQKVQVKAQSKIGSLSNVNHRPGGGDKKVFNDVEYLRQMSETSSVSPLGGNSKDNSRRQSAVQVRTRQRVFACCMRVLVLRLICTIHFLQLSTSESKAPNGGQNYAAQIRRKMVRESIQGLSCFSLPFFLVTHVFRILIISHSSSSS